MRKAAAILVLMFYLVPAVGFSITTHFCSGKLADISFYSADGTKCICGAEKMSSGCCTSNTTIVKIKDTQSKDATTEISFFKNSTKLFYSFPSFSIYTSQVVKIDRLQSGPPPDILIDDLIYILNRVFRI